MCPESATRDPLKNLTWPATIIYRTVRPNELCLKMDGTSVSRKCQLCMDEFPCWGNVTNLCTSLYSETSNDLLTLLNSNKSSSAITRVLRKIVKREVKLIPNDVHLIAEVINKLSSVKDDLNIEAIVDIISLVMETDLDVLKLSQETTNSSNIILASLDNLLETIASTTNDLEQTNDNLAIKIITLKDYNDNQIIAFYKTSPITIKHCITQDCLDYDNLAVAMVLPKTLIQYILMNNTKLAMVTFKTNSLFIETNRNYFRSVSWIPSAFVVNYTGTFPKTFRMIYKTNRKYRKKKYCSFWSFGLVGSEWKNESVASELCEHFQVCHFQHMTHFALLMGGLDDKVLDIVSSVGCAISILGNGGVLLTAIIFKNWRSENKAQIPINLSLVVMIQMVLLFFLDLIDSEKEEVLCLAFGIALHYSVLCQFCWLLIVTYLHYQRFVIIFLGHENLFLLKCYVIAYAVPLVPLSLTIIFLFGDYLADEYCYVSGNGLTFGVFIPVSLVICINLFFFILIFKNLPKKNTFFAPNKQLFWQLRLLFSFFFLSGLTWIFGLLSRLFQTIELSYFFCFTATFQGFIIFMCFIVFNSKNRKLWKLAISRDVLKRYDSNLNTARPSIQINSDHNI